MEATATSTELRTSQQWWDSIKLDPAKINEWLKNQYHGEAIAAERIEEFILPHFSGKYRFMVEKIMSDERTHAGWVGKLLETRGISAEVLQKEERYWREVLTPEMENDGHYAAAVAAHAEEMRLERIRVIMSDPESPADIKETFTQILKDEEFHAQAFKLIAGDEYYAKASENHARGLEALGLIV